jgi:hypothetical protein
MIYIILLLLIVSLYLLEGGDFYFAVLVAVVSVPILSLILLIISRRFIKVESVICSDNFYIDDECYIDVNIVNSSIIPISRCEVSILCNIYDKCSQTPEEFTVTTALKPKGASKIYLKNNFSKCIYAEYSAVSLKIYDIFGYFSFNKKTSKGIDNGCSFSIIPKINTDGDEDSTAKFNHNEPLLVKSEYINREMPEQSKLHSGEFDGVREYQVGDRMNQIHHKLSAKSDELYIRKYSSDDDPPLLVIFDSRDPEQFESLLERLVCCCSDLIAKQRKFELINIGFDDAPTPVTGLEGLKKHLVNIVRDMNTKLYNEYKSEYDRSFYQMIIEVCASSDACETVTYAR